MLDDGFGVARFDDRAAVEHDDGVSDVVGGGQIVRDVENRDRKLGV